MSSEIAALETKYQTILREVFGSLTPWEKVNMARHPSRPTALEYIEKLDRFDELHGDRQFRDGPIDRRRLRPIARALGDGDRSATRPRYQGNLLRNFRHAVARRLSESAVVWPRWRRVSTFRS